MPRQSRIDAPGSLHHVMIRGIEKRVIFRDDRDREAFLDRMDGILVESFTPCYAWSLLDNHAHFLLRTGKMPISRYLGVRKSGLTSATISKELGISPSAVRKAIERAQKGLQPDDIELP